MARRSPSEHERRPTVVTSGPQAGVARAGTTVNKGVGYDNETALSARGVKDGLVGLAAEPPERPADAFMPEHLRVLPANPAELFSDMELSVSLRNGEVHRVRWTPDGVELADHDYVAEKTLQVLGENVCRCVSLKDAWATEPSLLRSDADTLAFLHDVEVSGGGEGRNMYEDFVFRMGKTGASLYVARRAVDAWLQTHGVPSLRDERTVLAVFNGIPRKSTGYLPPSTIFSTGAFDEQARPVMGYATWTASSAPRFSGIVTGDFYDDVRDNGYVIDGKLNLGTNTKGRVLLHVERDLGDAFSVQQGADIAEEKYPHPSQLEEQRDPGNVQFIGVRQVWEDNGEYYYMAEGVYPVGVHRTAADALMWSRHENVRATMIDNSEPLSLYAEELDTSVLPSGVVPSEITQSELMEIAAAHGERPPTFSIGFTYYTAVRETEE